MENRQVKMLDVKMLKEYCNRINIQKQDLEDYVKECPKAIFGGIQINDDMGNIIDCRNGYWLDKNDWDYLENDDGTEHWAADEDIDVDYLIIDLYNGYWVDLTEDIIDGYNMRRQ